MKATIQKLKATGALTGPRGKAVKSRRSPRCRKADRVHILPLAAAGKAWTRADAEPEDLPVAYVPAFGGKDGVFQV